MSTTTVRAAVAQFLEGATVPGLSAVKPSVPYWADGADWKLADNLGNGAVGAIHIKEDSESRMTVPALTGQKIVKYDTVLMLFYQWLMPSNTLTPADESDWAPPLDVIIDGVKARLRSDPNCGMPATIFQSSQDADDLKVIRDLPRRLAGKVVAWTGVEFSVYEVITA